MVGCGFPELRWQLPSPGFETLWFDRMTPLPTKVSLVLSDVDGTLLTDDKVLTPRARAAVQSLRAARIRFAITSGRPPRGLQMLFAPLALDTPVAAFNGGVLVTRDLAVLQQKTLPAPVAIAAIDSLREYGLDPWAYRGNDWFVGDASAPHVAREARTVGFDPMVTEDVASDLTGVVKIVGVSDDHATVLRAESALRQSLGDRAAASRSQPYYLDVTHPDANKGAVVDYFARALEVPAAEIVTIGDGPNDVRMFDAGGYSIAMGNASAAVKAAADAVTDSHLDEGFAKAMETIVGRFRIPER